MLEIEKNLNTFGALRRLRALLPSGLNSVPSNVMSALQEDDYSQALKVANQRYAARRGVDKLAALIYACLLVGRELVVEARGVIEGALTTYGPQRAFSALLADALVIEGAVERALEALAEIEADEDTAPGTAAYAADIYMDLAEEDPAAPMRAIELYQLAVDADIQDPEPAIRLSQLYQTGGEFYAAAEAMEHAARLFKDRPASWETLAELWLEAGEELRSLWARARALKLGAEEREVEDWLELALEFAQFGELEEALRHLGTVEQMLHESIRSPSVDQYYAQMQLLRGNILLERFQMEEAIVAFRAAEERVGEHPVAQLRLAEAALLIGDLELAEAHARRSVQLRADDDEAWYFMGRVHQIYGRHAEASVAFERALTPQKEAPLWLSAAAISHYFLGDLPAAKDTLARAAELVEQTPEFLPLIGLDEEAWARIIAGLKRQNSPDAAWFAEKIALLGAQG